MPHSRPSRSGLRRTIRMATTLITSRPTARTVCTAPHPTAPSVLDTTSAPSTFHGPTLTALRKAKDTVITTTQRIDRKTVQPSARSRHSGRFATGGQLAPGWGVGRGCQEIRHGVGREGPAAADRGHQYAGDHGSEDPHGVLAAGQKCVGTLQVPARDELRHDAAERGLRERAHGATDDGEAGEHEQAVVARDQDRGHHGHHTGGGQVGHDEHGPSARTVGDRATHQQEHERGDHVGGQHDAEVGDTAGRLQHGESERDGGHGRAGQVDGPTEEEPAEPARERRVTGVAVTQAMSDTAEGKGNSCDVCGNNDGTMTGQ